MPDWAAPRAWRRLGRRPPVLAGATIVMLLFVTATLAPVLAPHNPVEQGLGPGLAPPGSVFVLGLDSLGRDVASRLMYGSRISLLVGAIAVSIALTAGLVLGVLAGYYGGAPHHGVVRGVPAALFFPPGPLSHAL